MLPPFFATNEAARLLREMKNGSVGEELALYSPLILGFHTITQGYGATYNRQEIESFVIVKGVLSLRQRCVGEKQQLGNDETFLSSFFSLSEGKTCRAGGAVYTSMTTSRIVFLVSIPN